MSHAPPDPEQTARAAEALCDPAVLRAEERLVMLRELAEIGMRLARALERRALAKDEVAEDPTALPASDPAAAFSSLSRAIRLTLTLEARTDEALSALKAGVEQAHERERVAATEAAVQKRQARESQVLAVVMGAAEADMRGEDDWGRLESEVDEYLSVDDAFWSDPERPLREIVERYCEYFGVAPDWSRWDGEDWTPSDPPPWPWAKARPTDPTASPTGDASGEPALALVAAHDLE